MSQCKQRNAAGLFSKKRISFNNAAQEPANSRVQKEVHPGFEPGLLEGDHVVKIQSDNHYTNEPVDQ